MSTIDRVRLIIRGAIRETYGAPSRERYARSRSGYGRIDAADSKPRKRRERHARDEYGNELDSLHLTPRGGVVTRTVRGPKVGGRYYSYVEVQGVHDDHRGGKTWVPLKTKTVHGTRISLEPEHEAIHQQNLQRRLRTGRYSKGRRHERYAVRGQSFEQWMREVDSACWKLNGCSIDDLPDVPLRDWYEDGKKPEAAARKARKAAQGGEMYAADSGQPSKHVSEANKLISYFGNHQTAFDHAIRQHKQASMEGKSKNREHWHKVASHIRGLGGGTERHAADAAGGRERYAMDERTRLRKLQDKFLTHPDVQHFAKTHGEHVPVDEGMPTIHQIKSFIHPNHKSFFERYVPTKTPRRK